MTKSIGPIVSGRPINPEVPDQGYEMTRAHRDTAGRVWPKDTRYQPRSMGGDEQIIAINGAAVVFSRAPLGWICDYQTGKRLLAATQSDVDSSKRAAAKDGGRGVYKAHIRGRLTSVYVDG